jgi:hypothetical protein
MRRNKAIIEELARFSNDVHGYMMSGGAVRPTVGGRPRGGGAARPAADPERRDRHRQRAGTPIRARRRSDRAAGRPPPPPDASRRKESQDRN